MPSLADLDLTASPRVDPVSYPGHAVDGDYLWMDAWLYEVRPERGAEAGRWEVRVDGGPLAGQSPPVSGLDDALSRAGAATVAARRPVIAFGSNTAPAQLADKFGSLPLRHRVVPVIRGTVRGLSLSHSPHVSPAGYVPYVLVDGGAATDLRVFVLWLDGHQLRTLNRTEPNYRPVTVDGHPITVENGDRVSEYLAYQGRWGALRWPGESGPAAARSQPEVFARLARVEWFGALVGTGEAAALMARLAGDSGLRDAVRVELTRSGLVTADGLSRMGGLDDGL